MEILSSSSVVDQVRATCGQLNYVDKSSDFAIHYTVNIPHIRFECPTLVSRDILVTSCPRVAIAPNTGANATRFSFWRPNPEN